MGTEQTLGNAGYTEYANGWIKYPGRGYINFVGQVFQVVSSTNGEIFVARFDSVEAAIVYAELEVANDQAN